MLQYFLNRYKPEECLKKVLVLVSRHWNLFLIGLSHLIIENINNTELDYDFHDGLDVGFVEVIIWDNRCKKRQACKKEKEIMSSCL